MITSQDDRMISKRLDLGLVPDTESEIKKDLSNLQEGSYVQLRSRDNVFFDDLDIGSIGKVVAIRKVPEEIIQDDENSHIPDDVELYKITIDFTVGYVFKPEDERENDGVLDDIYDPRISGLAARLSEQMTFDWDPDELEEGKEKGEKSHSMFNSLVKIHVEHPMNNEESQKKLSEAYKFLST